LTSAALTEIVIAAAPKQLGGGAPRRFIKLPVEGRALDNSRAGATGRRAADLFPSRKNSRRAANFAALSTRGAARMIFDGFSRNWTSQVPFDADAERWRRIPSPRSRTARSAPMCGVGVGAAGGRPGVAAGIFAPRSRNGLARGRRSSLSTRAEGEAGACGKFSPRKKEFAGFKPKIITGDLAAGFLARPAKGARLDWPLPGKTGPVAVVPRARFLGGTRSALRRFRQRQLPQRHRVDQLLDFRKSPRATTLVARRARRVPVSRAAQVDHARTPRRKSSRWNCGGLECTCRCTNRTCCARYTWAWRKSRQARQNWWENLERTRHDAERATLDFAAQLLLRPGRARPASGFCAAAGTRRGSNEIRGRVLRTRKRRTSCAASPR